MTFKKLVGKLHLWLGLASGLVVFIVSLTGCIYVFQHELFESTHRNLLFVTPPAGPARPLPYSAVWEKAQQALGPAKPLLSGNAYADPARAWTFMAYKGEPGELYFGKLIDYYETVYVNPYTGAVTGVLDNKYEFFQLVKNLHWSLFLGHAGELVVGYATLVFVLLLLSGLVLWWPTNKNARRQRFKIKWDASPKRLNYDLHNTVGFYLTLLALVIALTGLTWPFEWVRNSVRYLATGQTEQAKPDGQKGGKGGKGEEKPVPLTPAEQATANRALDAAVLATWQRLPGAISVGGRPATSLTEPLKLRAGLAEKRYQSAQLSFDPRTGAFRQQESYRDKSAGEQFIAMNYDLHVGSVLGWPTKVLAFLASLFIATLPVSGFYIWWGRKKKNRVPHRLARGTAAVA